MKNRFLFLLFAALALTACKDKSSALTPLPYAQDFEFATYPPAGWVTFPIAADTNWFRYTNVSGFGKGSACISFNNFAPSPSNGYRGIRLPVMDFTNVKHPFMRFDIAYAQRLVDSAKILTDTFGVWWSQDTASSSRSWINIISYGGVTLETAPPTPALFVPTPTQWQRKLVALPTLAGKPLLRLAIEDDWFDGNEIYFDNVLVFDSVVAAK